MFTGIVEQTGRVERPGRKLRVKTGFTDLAYGESVSVGGVCLTVAKLSGDVADFDLVNETLRKTTLGKLRRGDRVNLERSLRVGDRMSGHVVQGHVDGTGTVARAGKTMKVETDLAAQMVPKGSVTMPQRSPQNWSSTGIIAFAPAATARSVAASASAT